VRYDYRCVNCGDFEAAHPIGTAPREQPCDRCGATAARVLLAPALLSAPTARTRAEEADRRSAAEPAIVASPPPRGRTTRPANPLHAKLPRS
jgi:putative FmdB family regulatory protein